jgi:phenylalanyl-tRNA synthetase beta chain
VLVSPLQLACLLHRLRVVPPKPASMLADLRATRAGDTLRVAVPPTRSDVLHACDVAEDVAIAHGFNNVAETLPKCATIGRELPLNQLTELLRGDVAAAGFTEILTWALCAKVANFDSLRRRDDGAVEIGNPATHEFQARSCVNSVCSRFLAA